MQTSSRYLYIILTLLLSACQAPVKEEDIFNIPFSIITRGASSQLPLAKELVIKNDKEWQYLWLAHTGDPRGTAILCRS